MKKIKVNKFSSTTSRIPLKNPVAVEFTNSVNVGDVISVEALTQNEKYPNVELTTGELSEVKKGDIIVGVIGSRQALRGFVGYAPYKLKENDELYLLNIGGVIGRFISSAPGLGDPVKVRYIGVVRLNSRTVNMKDFAIAPSEFLFDSAPIVLVVGTCMNVGKTVCATSLVKKFAEAGHKVASAKLAGVAALKDLKKMQEAGALKTLSFIDVGLPSTIDTDNLVASVNGVINSLNEIHPDVIVVELGDGILGHYNLDSVIQNRNFMNSVGAVCLCATDLVAVYGARLILNDLGIPVTCISGPVTDTTAGTTYIESQFNLPAFNTFLEGDKIFESIVKELRKCSKPA